MRARGRDGIAIFRVDLVTSEGLEEAIQGVEVVVDVLYSPSR